ncbi:MAG: serine/threonine protein kinase [Deltaproteobacteria bacterium]|nr:MAG: serine/threonine protein kinase [Deltaproteobacteria bacterium]
MIGTTLDKYEVLQKVGEGGMATVYRGRHTTLGRDVAIKVLHPHLSSSTRNRKRFAREARAIEHLRHDNILEIFDYSGADAEDCYIVTEFVGGRTLTSLLDEHGKLPSEVAAIIGFALAKALSYAHDAGVLHRDLKPDNVMLRFDGTIKLMDFGIARFLDESQVTMTGALVGSPAFMSPEQAYEHELDHRSDLFSLGTLLFYLASGHLPFAGSNPSIILKNIIEGNRPELSEIAPSVSGTLAELVERLLQTDRETRCTSADEVCEALRTCLAEVDIDPTESRWTLTAWLEDPQAYARRLDHHLREVLLREGRRLLQQGDALTALRLLNRLLAIDEDNPEVLALVQSLHPPPPKQRSRAIAVVLGAAGLALAAFFVLSFMAGWWGTSEPTQPTARADRAPPDVSANPSEAVEDPSLDQSDATDPAPPSPEPSDPPPQPAPRSTAETPRTTPPPRRRADALRELRNPAPPPSPPSQGCLEVRPRNGWAYIWLNGEPTGRKTNAPGCIEVPAGTHTVHLGGSPLAEDLELHVTIAAGETQRVEPTLRFRPIRVLFDDHYAEECTLTVGERRRGTLAELGRVLELDRNPNVNHQISLRCADREHVAQVRSDAPLEWSFEPEGTP